MAAAMEKKGVVRVQSLRYPSPFLAHTTDLGPDDIAAQQPTVRVDYFSLFICAY